MRFWILGFLGITLVGVLACTVGGLSEEEVDSLSATAVAKALTAVPAPTPDIPATITAAVEATLVAVPTVTPVPVPTPKVIIVEKEVLKEVIKEVPVVKEVIVVKEVEVVVVATPTPTPKFIPAPTARAQPGEIERIRQFGTPTSDETLGISVDSTGVYVTGPTAGTFPGQSSAGGLDAFVRKYDTNGNVVWTRQFGAPASDVGRGISVDFTGVYVAGQTTGTLPGQTSAGGLDAFVRKYDTNGNVVSHLYEGRNPPTPSRKK